MTGFPPDVFLENSPINLTNYKSKLRVRFLLKALETKSLFAREELARLATQKRFGFTELLSLLQSGLNEKKTSLELNPKSVKILLDLAWLIANHPQTPSHEQPLGAAHDVEKALVIYRWCEYNFGIKIFDHMHLVDAFVLAQKTADEKLLAAIDTKKLKKPTKKYPMAMSYAGYLETHQKNYQRGLASGIDLEVDGELLVADIKNPFRAKLEKPQKLSQWFQPLRNALNISQDAVLDYSEELEPFDGLSNQPMKPIGKASLITIAIYSHKPKENLVTAVRSVLASSYTNIEVFVIDDRSGSDYEALLTRIEALDLRVRVVIQKEAVGAHRAYSRAIDESKGELITFLDATDWMHPRRLELQQAAIAKSQSVANICFAIAATENLELLEAHPRPALRPLARSLMMDRQLIKRKAGYLDPIKISAFDEYLERIEKRLKTKIQVIQPQIPLTITRYLTAEGENHESTSHWLVDYRRHYQACYRQWHRLTNRAFLDRNGYRSFFAPRPVRFSKELAFKTRQFDLVIATNLADSKNIAAAWKLTTEALQQKKTIAFFDLQALYPLDATTEIDPQVLNLLNSNMSRTVYEKDKLDINRLVVIAPNAFLMTSDDQPSSWRVRLFEVIELADAQEEFVMQSTGLQELLITKLDTKFRPHIGK